MDNSEWLIWLIPNGEGVLLEEKVYFKKYVLGDRDHSTFCKEFITKYQLDHKGRGESHIDYAQTFCENGISVGFNSGAMVDGKYFTTIFLSETLSPFQQDFLDSQKEVYEKKFHSAENMFSVLRYSKESLSYRSGYPNFRYLKIEALINNDKNKNNGQALLYQELDSIQEKNIL